MEEIPSQYRCGYLRATYEDLAQQIMQRFAEVIVTKWVQTHVHRCLSSDDLLTLYLAQSGPEENQNENSFYGTPESVMKAYYQLLSERVINVLYADKKIYDLEELELLVPLVESNWYNRDYIISQYTNMVNQLKTPAERDF